MDPLDYEYDSVNRSAILVKPNKPFIDWVNYVYPDTIVDNEVEATTYLIRIKDNNEEIEKWLKKNFDKIFRNELNDWHTEESEWPQKRTYKTFKEWFTLEISNLVLDTEDDDILKF
jgi:hypothetical protein